MGRLQHGIDAVKRFHNWIGIGHDCFLALGWKVETGNPVSRLTSKWGMEEPMQTVKELKREILLNAIARIDAVLEWQFEANETESALSEIRKQANKEIQMVDWM